MQLYPHLERQLNILFFINCKFNLSQYEILCITVKYYSIIFISDFFPGDNKMPEIEIDKDEFVRIYLTDEVPYKEAYRIIKN